MKLIRKRTFETNSSSTHALVVPHKVDEEEYSTYPSLWERYDFGREECRLVDDWDEKLAYTYIILCDYCDWGDGGRKHVVSQEQIDSFKKRVAKIYDEVYAIQKYKSDRMKPENIFSRIDKNSDFSCYVDHAHGLDDTNFIDRILNEKEDEFLKKFIFNKKSYITVGGDEYRGYNIKSIGFEYDYEEHWHCVNEKGEQPPKEWLDERGCIKDEYWDRYIEEYPYQSGEFWDKLKEYEKENDVFLKGC